MQPGALAAVFAHSNSGKRKRLPPWENSLNTCREREGKPGGRQNRMAFSGVCLSGAGGSFHTEQQHVIGGEGPVFFGGKVFRFVAYHP